MNQYLELDLHLAQLRGHTGVDAVDVNPTMNWVTAFPIGYRADKPGEYGPTFDRITLVWCNMNENNTGHAGAIIDLMAEYEADVEWRGATVRVTVINDAGQTAGCEVLISAHPDKQTALRVAVVSAVITLLEAKNDT